MKNLKGKTALITGAAHGIGLALSKACTSAMMDVVMVDIAEEALDKSASDVRSGGHNVLPVLADVTNSEDWARIRKLAEAEFEEINLLINNAGVLGEPGRLWQIAPEEWERVLNINVRSILNSLREFVPVFLEQDGPKHVVNIGSVAGHVVQPFNGPYHISKFSVTAITESLFHEFDLMDASIGLTLVSPGFTRTNIMSDENFAGGVSGDAQLEKLRASFAKGVEEGATAEDVADQILEAVRNNQFYHFPSRYALSLLDERFGHILTGDNPDLGDHMRARFKLDEE